MKISVKEAIISGEWVEYSLPKLWIMESCCVFRLRPIKFEKILVSEKDNISNLLSNRYQMDEGVLWLLKIEVVNLSRTSFCGSGIGFSIALHDQDDFVFYTACEKNLEPYSVFSRASGFSRFYRCRTNLQPKIKAVGAVAFLLPDDDQAEYFLSVKKGSIQAV